MNAKTKPTISRRRLFFLFWSSSLNFWAKTEIHTIRFRRTPPGYERATPSENCVPKGGKSRPYPRGVIWDEDLCCLVFTLEFEQKIYLFPHKYFLYPPPQSRYSGTGPALTLGITAQKSFIVFFSFLPKELFTPSVQHLRAFRFFLDLQ